MAKEQRVKGPSKNRAQKLQIILYSLQYRPVIKKPRVFRVLSYDPTSPQEDSQIHN